MVNSSKGKYHPYVFHYNNETGTDYGYGYLLTDRWGTYKSRTSNASRDSHFAMMSSLYNQ